jgi:hypothetical protein
MTRPTVSLKLNKTSPTSTSGIRNFATAALVRNCDAERAKTFRVSMSLIESQGVEPSGLSENQALSFVGGVLPIEISKKSPNREVVLSPGIKAHKSLIRLKERLIISLVVFN